MLIPWRVIIIVLSYHVAVPKSWILLLRTTFSLDLSRFKMGNHPCAQAINQDETLGRRVFGLCSKDMLVLGSVVVSLGKVGCTGPLAVNEI